MTGIGDTIGDGIIAAATYVLAWWLGHPGEEDAFNAMEMPESRAYRDELYDQINAATEGRLSQLVDRDRDWVIAFGVACSGVLNK